MYEEKAGFMVVMYALWSVIDARLKLLHEPPAILLPVACSKMKTLIRHADGS